MTWAELKNVIDSMSNEEVNKDVQIWDSVRGGFYDVYECSEFDPINDPGKDYSLSFNSFHGYC